MNKKCYNCKFAGITFKIAGKTHMHCEHPKQDAEFKANENYSAWDTLREFWETCEDHSLKPGIVLKDKPVSNQLVLI